MFTIRSFVAKRATGMCVYGHSPRHARMRIIMHGTQETGLKKANGETYANHAMGPMSSSHPDQHGKRESKAAKGLPLVWTLALVSPPPMVHTHTTTE